MPPKKRIVLPDDVREAFKQRLAHVKRVSDRASEDFHVEVYLMNKSGMTFDEIAEIFDTRSSTVTDWKRKGEEAYNRREQARSGSAGRDPDRSGEPEPVS